MVARSRNQVRIAQIVPSLEERHGGPSKSVRRLAAALARLGHEVDLLTSVPGEESASPPEAGLRVHQFGRAWPDAICRAPALREHLRRHDYECLHHHALWLRTLHYANEARARTGAAFIISPRGMASDWAWAHRRWKKRLAGRLIHQLIQRLRLPAKIIVIAVVHRDDAVVARRECRDLTSRSAAVGDGCHRHVET